MLTSTNLPRVRGLPIIGNLHQLPTQKLPTVFERWANELGPTFRFRILNRDGVAFAGLDNILDILKRRPDDFRRVAQMEVESKALMLDGVFAAEGDRWRRQRKLVSPAFSRSALADGVGHVSKVLKRLVTEWEKKVGTEFEARRDLMCFTADVTTQLAFGYDLDTLTQGEGLQEEIQTIFEVLIHRLLIPIPYWRYVQFPADRRASRAVAEVSGRLLKLIEQSQKDPIRGTALQALIDTRQKPEGEAVGEEPLSNSEIVGNVMTLLLAGEDTTANALAWSLLYLATQPEILKKVREEADRVLGPTGVPESLEQANALVYAGHVFKEVLRMRSPAPLMFMEPTRDLEVGGLNLKQGQPVAVLTRKTAMDPQHFTDPERFWPERWASPSPAPQHTPRAMLAFGGGPRTCLGAQLAMIEGQSVLATICRAFDFELRCDPRAIEEVFAFVMYPSQMPIRLRRRSS